MKERPSGVNIVNRPVSFGEKDEQADCEESVAKKNQGFGFERKFFRSNHRE